VKKVLGVLLACVLILSLLSFGLPAFADPGDHGKPVPEVGPVEPVYPDDPNPGEAYEGYTGDPYTRDPTELITKEYFGNEWVNTIPDDPSVTSPWEHHGYIAGSPLQLTPYDGPGGTYDYFATLAKDSPRVTMWNIGETNLGLDEFIVAISSADTIARLDKYQENLQKLADPRSTTEEEAEALFNDASKLKPIFWIWTKVHSAETGSSEMTMELAYRLAVDKRPMFDEIRDNVIVFITDPNPDGTEMTSNWVNHYLDLYGEIDKGFNEGWEPRAPFYNWYTQHDNNRDTHTNSQPAQLNLVKAYNDWPAQTTLDIHEAIFLIYTFNGMEPTFPSIDPITQSEWQWYAFRELNQAEQFGMPGVWTYKYVNMYYPFYQNQMANLRNGCAKFYEVYGHTYPTTVVREAPFEFYTLEPPQTLQTWFWFNPLPYESNKVVWSFRNNINYSQTLVLTTAWQMARNRETVLRNFWVKSKNAVGNAGQTEIGANGYFTFPYAYVIPAEQKDMPDTIRMINNLLGNGIAIYTADEDFMDYPAGSWIMRLDTPHSDLVYALFDIQVLSPEYPAPYDATAWQYDLMRDVVVDRITDEAILDVAMTPVTAEELAYPYTVSEKIDEGYYVIDHDSINNIITLVFSLDRGGFTCYAAEGEDGDIAVGDVLVPAEQEGVYEELAGLVEELGLTMHFVAEVEVETHELNAPRIGMYHSWRCIQDGGWSRFTFEQFIPKDGEDYYNYKVIQRTDVIAGDLIKDYDVIFLPDVRGSQMVSGDSFGDVPEEVWYGPVQTTARTGGLGTAGIAALKEFVDAGGLLICNNASCDFPIDNEFIEDVTIVKAANAAGPIVRILPNLALGNPITYGADEEECVYQNQSPAFTAPEEWVVASYPDDPADILLSGLLEGAENLAGKAVIVDAPSKDEPENGGHVVLFGTDITYRWQAHGAYFYLWNAIMNWDD